VLAIDDVNGDGRASFTLDGTQIESPDKLFGASTSDVIGFVRDDGAQVIYRGVPIGPGFHLLDPCYTTPVVRRESRTIEVTLFPPARHLSVGAQPTLACPVVLFPRVRGPLQQMLAESAECEAVCALMTQATCAQSCSSEMCLRLVQSSRCYAAKRHRLQCLRDHGKTECTSKSQGSFNEGECPSFNEECAAVDEDAQAAALAGGATCQGYCALRARGVRPDACAGDCASEACAAATATQPCLAAREARLACLSNHSTSWSCTPFFGEGTNLCSATGSFDHLCPDAY